METLQQPVYAIEPTPRWIKRRVIEPERAGSRPDLPYFFLLADYQEQILQYEIHSFYRLVHRVNDVSQLENASQHIRELRPDNERLLFHRIDILRAGRRITALNPDNIATYQNEDELRQHHVRNGISVFHSIDDLRVGDVIDLQATIVQRANEHPFLGRDYHAWFSLTWEIPVLEQYLRFVNRTARGLVLHQHKIEDGRCSEDYVELPPRRECERRYDNLQPVKISATAPTWLQPDFLIATTEHDWPEVSRNGHAVFQHAHDDHGKIGHRDVDRLELCGNRRSDALRLIRFVQNEIRYHSDCSGIYSHTPRSPREVLRRGAGDCKGKAKLLIELLDSIDVPANPVLTDADIGKHLDIYRPSSGHFSHVIVRVRLDDGDFYFDPTIKHQAGDFEHAAQLDYGFVLNLTAEGEDILRLPLDLEREAVEIQHRVDLRDLGSASVTVTRRYRGHIADSLRGWIASSLNDAIEREFFERAENDIVADIERDQPFRVLEDDRHKNLVVTEERYRLMRLEQYVKDDDLSITTNFYKAYPYPDDARFALETTADGVLRHRVVVHYPLAFGAAPERSEISAPCFHCVKETRIADGVYQADTILRPRRRVVDQAEIDAYVEQTGQLYDERKNRFPVRPGKPSRKLRFIGELPWFALCCAWFCYLWVKHWR